MNSSKDIKILETFTDKSMKIDLSQILINSKNVDEFKKINRIGEGTYGTVCKSKKNDR